MLENSVFNSNLYRLARTRFGAPGQFPHWKSYNKNAAAIYSAQGVPKSRR
jgi:hypothetical protein